MTKSKFAKEIGVSPASITAYVSKGLPITADGRIDLAAGKLWVDLNIVPTRGGWNKGISGAATTKRKRGCESAAEPFDPSKQSEDFQVGAAWMATRLCSSARTAWVRFVAGMDLTHVTQEHHLAVRALFTILMPHLLESWASDFIQVDQVPEIDYTVFGRDAKAVKTEAEELRAEWAC